MGSLSKTPAEFIEMEAQSEGIESELIADTFLCCICLDLLYKPVVLACGHASCFWCVHKSMNHLHESHCPICRQHYHHFPTICQMLHAMLYKLYPVTYKRRETQILAEEQKTGCFSPNLDKFHASSAKESCKINVQAQSSITSQDNYSANECETEIYEDNMVGASSVAAKLHTNCNDISHQIAIDDVLCATCKQLLFRPVVLNCGHVHCESCLAPVDGPIKCQVCQNPQPKGFAKVYLDFDHFIEEGFTVEYLARKSTVQQKQVHFPYEDQPNGSKNVDKDSVQFPSPSDEKIHVGAGCDYCGMYPIIGERYRCKDCKETMGFDLCGDCYNTKSKLPGRFNQQHTSEHKFEVVSSLTLYNIMLKLLRGQAESLIPLQLFVPENGEGISQENVENTENAELGPLTPTEDHQDDEGPSAL